MQHFEKEYRTAFFFFFFSNFTFSPHFRIWFPLLCLLSPFVIICVSLFLFDRLYFTLLQNSAANKMFRLSRSVQKLNQNLARENLR